MKLHDGYQRLAVAVLMNAYRESKNEMKLLEYQKPEEAKDFLCSEDCRLWCDIAGIQFDDALKTLERIENEYTQLYEGLQPAQDNGFMEV